MNNPSPDDWRRHGQKAYISGIKLIARDYYPYRPGWDHDHCAFCGATFSMCEGDLKRGYSSEDFYHWICGQCFNDFKEEFKWQVDK